MQNYIILIFVLIAILMAVIVTLSVRLKNLRKKNSRLERIATLVESAPYYIAYDDMGESDLYANPAACRMVGRPIGEPIKIGRAHV